MGTLIQDLKFGLRMLRKTPVITVTAAISLGVGVTAVTMAMALANGFLFEPFPYHDQDALVATWEANPRDDQSAVAPANFLEWRQATQSLESIEAWTTDVANLTGLDQPEEVQYGGVTVGAFGALGRSPVLGRDFRPEEGVEGSNRVLILDYDYWQATFEGAPDVLGTTVQLDGVPYTIIGVMPEDFELFPANLDMYRPIVPQPDDWSRSLMAFGRLRPGHTVEQAQAELGAVAEGLRDADASNENVRAHVQRMRAVFPGPVDSRLVEIYLLVAAFVLVIAAANVAGLLLARAETRNREIAVRTALGARRGRIIVQMLTEAVLLALVGAGVGLLGSIWAVRGLAAAMPPELPRAFMPRLDTTVLLLTVIAAVFTGLLFGATPAFHALRTDLRGSLTEGSRGGTSGRGRTRLRGAFVAGEIAVALALLTAAGILVRTFQEMVNVEPGFQVEGLLTMRISLPEQRYPDDASIVRFHDELIRTLGAMPGTQGAAVMSAPPRSRFVPTAAFATREQLDLDRDDRPQALMQAINPAFFATLGSAILRGRAIEDADQAGTPRVAVINQRLVDRYYPDTDPIGQQLRVGDTDYQVVGIARDMVQSRIVGAEGIAPAIFVAETQAPRRTITVALRATGGDPTDLAPAARQAVWSIDPDLPIGAVRSLADHIDQELMGPRAIGLIMAILSALALALAGIGIYGIIAYTVTQRSREIGIRMALGADGSRVLYLVARQGMRLTAIGLLVGSPLAFAMYRLVAGTAFLDLGAFATPGFFATVAGLLVAVALASTLIPAGRATRIEPARALTD